MGSAKVKTGRKITPKAEVVPIPESVAHRLEYIRDRRGVAGLRFASDKHANRWQTLVLRPDRVKRRKYHLWHQKNNQQPRLLLQRPPVVRNERSEVVPRLELAVESQIGRVILAALEEAVPVFGEAGKQAHQQHRADLSERAFRIGTAIVERLLAVIVPPAYLRMARRFPPLQRGLMYEAFCRYGEPALSLANGFPVLAIAAFRPIRILDEHWDKGATAILPTGEDIAWWVSFFSDASPKRLAKMANMPPYWRRIHPAATECFPDDLLTMDVLFRQTLGDNRAAQLLPESPRYQREWLANMLRIADKPLMGRYQPLPQDLLVWLAENFFQFGADPDTRERTLHDLADWLRWVIRDPDAIPRFRGDRGFSRDMAPETAIRAMERWHDWLGEREVTDYPLPDPPLNGATIGSYQVVPLTRSQEVAREGAVQRHCASSYLPEAAAGRIFLYSIRTAPDAHTGISKRVATLALEPDSDGRYAIAQLRGFANEEVSPAVWYAATSWLEKGGSGGDDLEGV